MESKHPDGQVHSSGEDDGSGSFTIELHSLALTNSSLLPVKQQTVWIFVQLLTATGAPLNSVWFGDEDDNLFTRSVSLPIENGEAEEIATTIPLHYSQPSKRIPLTKNSLSMLLQAKLQLSLYSGSTRSTTTDECLGVQQVSLRPAIIAAQWETEVTFTAKTDAPAIAVLMSVQCDVDLADFTLGSRLLTWQALEIINLPAEWTATATAACESDEDAVQFCAAVDRNTVTYDLTCMLPECLSDERLTEEMEIFAVQGGKLSYEPSSDSSVLEWERDHNTVAVGAAIDEPLSSSNKLTGVWKVAFPQESTATIFTKLYFKSAVIRLIEFLTVQKHVTVVLKRANPVEGGKVPDILMTRLSVDLSQLLTPGATRINLNVQIPAVTPVTKEALEQELASATTSDDKKRLQAALAEYDTVTLPQAAAVSASMAAANTQLTGIVEILETPLMRLPPADVVVPDVEMHQLIPPRDLLEEREQQHDVLTDLRNEIRRVVLTLLHEYENCFPQPSADAIAATSPSPTQEEKKQKFVYRLNTQGAYHTFKETLKKRIIPVIRDRFARPDLPEEDDDEEDEDVTEGDQQQYQQRLATQTRKESRANEKKKAYMGQVYTLLMEEVQHLLHEAIYGDIDALAKTNTAMQGKPTQTEVSKTLDTLRLKALENKVNGDLDKCERLHLDRIAYADEFAIESLETLVAVRYDYACFCLMRGKLDTAGASLELCLALKNTSLSPLLTFVALHCEQKDFARAEVLAKHAVIQALANYSSTSTSSSTSRRERKGDDLVLAHALLAFSFTHSGKDPTGNLALFELLKAQQFLQQLSSRPGDVTSANNPSKSVSAVWLFLADFANKLRLHALTQRALHLADQQKAPRDALSSEERMMKRALAAELSLLGGELEPTVRLLQEALEIDASHPLTWLLLGKTYLQHRHHSPTTAETAIECFQRALENHHHPLFQSREELRLELYLNLGLVLLQNTQFAAAKAVFLQSCDEFQIASNWLGVGIACMRMEKFDAAHLALAEANRLDSTNADVWGYLALHALTASASASHSRISAREEQDAKQFVVQALRYNLSNPVLLRELSSGFVAIDRLEDAERLLRRSLACQDSSLTRKTLADVLAAQNCAEDALQQYKQSLDEWDTVSERCDLLEKCARLLVTLGRPEEASEYRKMANQFHVEMERRGDEDGKSETLDPVI